MNTSYEKEEFARLYLKHGCNATRAAMAAFDCGRSEASGKASRMMEDPEVNAAILQLVEDRNAQLQIDANWVLQEAVTVYERCMQVEKILDRDGNPTGAFVFDATNALKALALIGKHADVQAFEQRLSDSRDNELLQRLLRGRQRVALPAPCDQVVDDLTDDTPPVSFMGEPSQEPPQWQQRGQRQTAEALGYPGSILVDGEWSEGGRG